MNLHLILSLLIVAATAVVAILQENRRTKLETEHVALKEEAVALGLPVDAAAVAKSDLASSAHAVRGSGNGRASRSPRARGGTADAEEAARAFSQELFAFAERVKEWEKRGEEPSREDRLMLMTFLNRFLELDPEVIPHLMREVRAYDGLEDNDKRNIMGLAMMTLSQSSPERALDLYINSGDLFGENREATHMLRQALHSWAGQDPKAALAWLDLNGPSLESNAVAEARRFAIASSFKHDPERAVDLALELDREHMEGLARQIGALMQTPENQLDLLRRVQDRLGELPADPDAFFTAELAATASDEQVLRGVLLLGLGRTLTDQSFESARGFLDTAQLDPTESFLVARGLAENSSALSDPGSWLPWIHSNSPAAQRDHTVGTVVEQWTRTDFRSAAEWIGTQSPGPLREQATYSFAETVAPHEPASAAEWALTLPASNERTDLLRTIHNEWRGKDQQAADAFAAEHGLAE